MRLPTPAAGTIPHILLNLSNHLPLIKISDRGQTASRVQNVFQFNSSMSCGVRLEHSSTTSVRNSGEFIMWQLHRLDHVVGGASDDDLDFRLKERLQALPVIRHDRHTARSRFKQTTRWAVA